MKSWTPSDILVLLIVLLIIIIVSFAVWSVYSGVPFHEGRSKAMSSLVDSLVAIVAMYLGSRLREKD